MDTSTWLLDSDPAIQWQVMRDITGDSDDAVASERSRITHEGWGARLLALQDDAGQWAGGTYFPKLDAPPEHQPWTATAHALVQLRDYGVDPTDDRVRRAVSLVAENSRWEYDGSRFFDGEVEPCVNGLAVTVGAYFGESVDGIVERLLTEQMDDGGWNCEAENGSTRGSFHTTIQVLEGLAEYEASVGSRPAVTEARARAHEYLLQRRLMRRLSTGEPIDNAWLKFSFPTRWHYDVLRALDYFQASGTAPDARMAEAIDLVREKRTNSAWPLENTHRGAVHFTMESDGDPSRWNTLRALRVLDWWDGRTAPRHR